MSMISAQCDELRSMAASVGLEAPQAATLMMDAADTIDRLDLALDSKRIAERRVTELLAENAKLLKELEAEHALAEALGHYHEDAKAENVRLRELAEEDSDQLDKWQKKAEYYSQLLQLAEAENAKLRELCRRFSEYVSQDRCEGCVCKMRCNDGLIDECWQRTEIRKMARELGVEIEA